jgi:hypothetical protein
MHRPRLLSLCVYTFNSIKITAVLCLTWPFRIVYDVYCALVLLAAEKTLNLMSFDLREGLYKLLLVDTLMEQRTLNVNHYLKSNIYSYFETFGGQSSKLYLNIIHFSTTELIRHLWHLKTIIFLHWCLICIVLLLSFV